MIPKSSFAAAKDESRACLAGILWENFPNKTGMVATDGHRLGSCFVNCQLPVNRKNQQHYLSQKPESPGSYP